MTRYVVDASVVIKWFVPEVHTDAALRYLDDAHERLAPDLLLPETGNILWKKVRLGEITEGEGRNILRAVAAAPIQIHPSGPLLDPAFAIARALDRSVYDSLYLALAVAHECRMVTADRRLHNALRNTPLAAHLRWVEDAP